VEILSFMLARVPDLKGKIVAIFLLAAASALLSCASQKEQVRLVDDPDEHSESSIPWNKQEKWESQSQFAGITDRR
jgi:hypothetical protein